MTISVRGATPKDAAALSQLAAATFRETYERENTPENMQRYIADMFTPEKQSAEIVDPGATVLIAERSGENAAREMVGYVHLASGAAPPEIPGSNRIEIKRFYVSRAFHGRRVAQALMDAAIDAASAVGSDTIWLGVWERNPRAAAFYAKYGFTRVGQQTFVLGADAQTDWLLARPVATPARDAAL
jgi:diamine N-acetyltransferase